MEGYGRFLALLGSALLLGFLSVVFALVWVLHYREGLAWDGDAQFNWHPVLIITGFVFVQGIGYCFAGGLRTEIADVEFGNQFPALNVFRAASIMWHPCAAFTILITALCIPIKQCPTHGGLVTEFAESSVCIAKAVKLTPEEGPAIIVYRLPWTWKCSKLLMKLIHAGLNTIALMLAIISLVAVFDFHNAKKIPNMYSLHSWIGLTAVILYALQLVLGFVVFLLPFAPSSLRATVMPIHVYSGLLIFGTVIATALMGITEKLIFALKSPNAYSTSPPEAIFVNTLGVLILVFGAAVLWIATRPHWKRPPEPNSKIQQHNRGTLDDNEEGTTAADCSNENKSDVEFSGEAAARKRNPKMDEAGQRSTM
ncbi:Cytochrome b reductase 1 [Varanus komodoensis]|nr:Cytochrome b reductase 1 [Varanus komodoensis]